MSDLKLINQWTSDNIYEFFHKVFDVCCDTNIADLNHYIRRTLTIDDLKTFQKHSIDNRSLLGIFQYFVGLFGENIEETYIKSRLDGENLSDNVQNIVMECYKAQKLRLFKALVYRVAHHNHSCMENYDWSLLYVISNDQMSDMNTSLLKLSLVVEKSAQNMFDHKPQTETFTFELTKTELLEFIEFLQLAQQELLDQLKTNPMV